MVCTKLIPPFIFSNTEGIRIISYDGGGSVKLLYFSKLVASTLGFCGYVAAFIYC